MAGILTNPITFAHVQARGGWQRQMVYAGGYLAIVGSLIAITAYSRGRWETELLGGWIYTLMALQTGTALLFGATRITAAIRRDLSDEMIDSIRLMPLPASQAVLGYILAGAGQAGSIMFANFILGLSICVPAGFAVAQWITANFILVFFSLFVWVVIAMLSYLTRAAAVMVFGALAMISVMQGVPALILPGLAVLLTPLMGRSIFSMRNTMNDLVPQLGAATVAQTAIGIVCFMAACRKFRRSDVPAFTSTLGIILLLTWQSTSVLGFYQYDELRPRWMGIGMSRIPQHAQMIASFLVAMLISLLPVVASVVENNSSRRSQSRWRLDVNAVVMICIAICMMLLIFPAETSSRFIFAESAVWTLALVGTFLFSAAYFAQWLIRLRVKGRLWIGGGAIIVLIVIPLALDGLRIAMLENATNEEMSALGAVSPLGYLIAAWADVTIDLRYGAAFYGGLSVLLALLSYRARKSGLGLPNPKACLLYTSDAADE